MVIDFHTHGKITNQFPFEKEEFHRKIEEAKKVGLDAFALTEHSHAKNFGEAYKYLEENFSYQDDFYLVDGIKVFTGVEVTTKERFDFLFIGKRDDIKKFNEQILDSLEEGEKIPIQKLIELVQKENFVIILAHPYRKCEEVPEFEKNILETIDAIEFNARDLADFGIENMQERVKRLGEKLQLHITGGSDSHYFLQIGSISNKLPKECKTVQELKEEIRKGDFQVKVSEELDIRVRASKIIKKILLDKKN